MTRRLVIGIDSSTTGCKAIAWDRTGKAVAEGRAGYELLQPKPNWYEQDAEEWWGGMCDALRVLLAQIDPSRVEAVCITHQRESFVPVDRNGAPLRYAILWLDERSHAQVQELERTLGADRFHQTTGKPLTANPSASKILWLAQHEPGIIARAFKLLDAHAFLVFRLVGSFYTSLACADPMGLVDIRTREWSDELVRAVGLHPEQLPELGPPGAVIGRVTRAAAKDTGLPVGLPVVAGAGDGQCAGLGANATGEGRAALNLGTAVVSGTTSAEPLIDRAFRTLYAPTDGEYYLETVILSGVFTINWFVDKFGADLTGSGKLESPEEILEAAAAKVPPGASGLMLAPYWSHAITPYWDDSARGVTIGWTGAHGREHFYRAILEGIAFEQHLAGDGVMAAIGAPFQEYVALGGGSRSDLWCQIMADVTGVPVCRSATTEATCLGAGILAAAVVGWYTAPAPAAEAMTSTAVQFMPDAEKHAYYDELFREVYRPLYPTLQALIRRLAELTRD